MTEPNGVPTPDGTDAASGADEWAVPGYTPMWELGSGASGRVVLATHDGTGTQVAIKYLSERLRRDSTFCAGFRAEARLLGALRSPYVVELYEYVDDPRGAAIVMELVDGVPLRVLLRQHGATGPEAALTVLKGSLLGLAAAHAAGVVHRDYKPDNVLIAADGTSKLVDFGIAVPSGEAGNAVGTPVYMAPEQWTGQPASPATDVYAATATFFECLTGAKPYAGDTVMELAIQHMEAPIPDGQAPEPVRPLIRSGLAKTPGERPASAQDFVDALEALATQAYGEEWEERGQRKLAAMAALLLLLPSGDGGASGTTALATTTLGARRVPHNRRFLSRRPLSRRSLSRRAMALAGMAAAAVLVAGLTVAAVANGDDSVDQSSAPGSKTTGSPSGSAPPAAAASTGPSKEGTPSASVSAKEELSASPKASPDTDASSGSSVGGSSGGTSDGNGGTSGSASGGDGPSGGSAGGGTTTSGGSSGGSTTAPTVAPTTPAPTLDVESVTINASGPLGSGCTMVVSVTVRTNGAAEGTLTLSWFGSASPRVVGTVSATERVTLPKGQTQVSGRYTHTFPTPERASYLGVKVSTSPAARSGNGSFVTTTAPAGCDPVR
jgi:serine/threonine-protein kinase